MSRILKVVLVAGGLGAAGLVGYGAGTMGAFAQGGPGMGPGGPGMGPGGPGMMMERGDGPMGPGAWRDGPRRGQWGERGWHRGEHRPGGPFGRFFINRDNKNLSNDDVRKIAEAGLLWFGERNWRIGEVTDAGSRAARFTLTTENGGVIATFEMDRDTGRVRRVG
ncbi:hypothetical protein [Elioraea sp.]|uniref:hypothetical protein n=1 Tax=Elioraea sp. TaxID=2185103 RepID=UPI0021DEE1C2|nr:hypothetical protein [Elioraea sp.]GIX08559.1 MAG: hypothetical protein KatS3mg116_0269 [Elioraea sp.]